MDETELVKAGFQAAIQPFADLVARLFGGPCDQIGGIWEDALKVRRTVRQVKLYQKLQKFVTESGIDPQQIPDKVWIPAMTAACREDDESLQDRWAALLVNAADPRQTVSVLPSFTTILTELMARDAHFLEAIYSEMKGRTEKCPNIAMTMTFDKEYLLGVYGCAGLSRTKDLNLIYAEQYRENKTDVDADYAEFNVSLSTLRRHGLIYEQETTRYYEDVVRPQSVLTDPTVKMPRLIAETTYSLSDLAVSFVRACQAPSRTE